MNTAGANHYLHYHYLLSDKPTVPSSGVGRHLCVDVDGALSVSCIAGTVQLHIGPLAGAL